MRKVVIITAAAILAMFGFANPSVAVTDADGCADASPNSVDIEALTASSDGTNITVIMTLCAVPVSGAKYRVHFDYDDGNGLADNVTRTAGSCAITNPVNNPRGTTSDDTAMRSIRPNRTKDTGPGTIGVVGDILTYTVPYTDLSVGGVVQTGDTVLIWADTHKKGIKDRSPDTDDTDGCSKPTGVDEVIATVLD